MRRTLIRAAIFWVVLGAIGAGFIYFGKHSVVHGFDQDVAITSFDTVFLGDSITAQGRWSGIELMGFRRNRGRDGDRTVDILERAGRIAQAEPRRVYVMAGINDLLHGVPQEETVRNYQMILETLLRGTPKERVYVQSVLPVRSFGGDAGQVNAEVAKLNESLQALARQLGVTYIDLYSVFADKEGLLREDLTTDGLHLNHEGYRLWRDALARVDS